MTSSSNLNPSLNPKIISNTKLSKEEKLRHDDISKNKVDINVKLEPKRVSLYNSRNQVTPSYKSISGETKIHSDIRRTNKETLNNKGSVDSKKESNYKNISSNETIQKVTLSLYIDNYSQNKFRSSYTNLNKYTNTNLQKSLSPSKALKSKQKDESNTITINGFSIKSGRSNIKDNTNNNNSHVRVSNISAEMVGNINKVTTTFSKPISLEKSSRNKSVGVNKIFPAENSYGVTKRENFKTKSKLFSSCSNIRSSNGTYTIIFRNEKD